MQRKRNYYAGLASGLAVIIYWTALNSYIKIIFTMNARRCDCIAEHIMVGWTDAFDWSNFFPFFYSL